MATRIQLKAIKPDFEKAATIVCPYFDTVSHCFIVEGKRYQATERINAKSDESRWVCDPPVAPIRLVDDMVGVRLEHNMEFDPKDPIDMFKLAIARDSGFVAKDVRSVNTGGTHRLYISDANEEARAASSHADLIFEAMGLIRSMRLSDKRDLAFYMRAPVKDMNEEMVDGFVKKLATSDPRTVIKNLEEKDYKVRALLQRLLQYGLLQNDGGQIKNGPNVIGVDLDGAVHYIKDSTNQTFMKQLYSRLKEEEAKGGVINEPLSEKATA